jgi:hypothetical protein
MYGMNAHAYNDRFEQGPRCNWKWVVTWHVQAGLSFLRSYEPENAVATRRSGRSAQCSLVHEFF